MNNPEPPIGIYRPGPKIEDFFMDCGLDMRIGNSSRLPATIDFLRQFAGEWDGGDEKLKRVLLKVCDPRENLSDPDNAVAMAKKLSRLTKFSLVSGGIWQ